MQELMILHLNANYEDFRSLCALHFWTKNERTYIFCAVVLLGQVKKDISEINRDQNLKTANKVFPHLKNKINVLLQYPKLDKTFLLI